MKNNVFKFTLSFCLVLLLFLFSCKKDESITPTVKVTALSTVNVQANKMCFVSAQVAFAACNGSKLFKTSNGGGNWSPVATFPQVVNDDLSIADLTDIKFVSSTKGFVLGGGKVYKTTDSGVTWEQILFWSNFEAATMSFPTSTCGYIAANTAIYQTTDGGTYWDQINSPSFDCEPYKMAFATPDTGIVTDYFNDYTYYTTNGGSTWTSKYNDKITYSREIKFVSKTEGYAVNVGTVYKTTDKGVTWSTVQSSNTATEFTLSGVDVNSSLGFAVGDMSIFVSTNNGSNWEYRFTDKGINLDDWLTDVHVLNGKSAIASSESGTFYKIEIGEQ